LAAALTIHAAGGVAWREAGSGVEVAVVHRPRYDDWSLPKGKLHAGEPLTAAARREVTEETGMDAALGRWLGRTRYRVAEEHDATEKCVDYWSARTGEVAPAQAGDEVDEVAWLGLAAARERLSWDADRTVLATFAQAPAATSTVLLVRHARAGTREAWRGPDDERPLDVAGRAQVEALAATLPPFWLPTERPLVVSAPVQRCLETVAWAGDVKTDERLGERTYADYPVSTVVCLRELAAAARVSVACSQGGVIPAVIETLRRADGFGPAGVRAAKGSAWVLSFVDGRLVAADYLDAA
jgi:8-oxo-dGTP pyrophosphatase MutT (NUDIX family)/phosphohistidine phosphatase SixA